MTAVGLDYSLKKLNVAAVRGREIVFHDEVKLGEVASRTRGITGLVGMWASEYGPVAIYMEQPWLGQNVQTLIALSRLVGAIEALAVDAGHTVTLVAPETWRAAVSLPAAGRTRKDKKAAAQATVRAEFGLEVSHDEADAILLGVYGASLERREAMVRA